MANAHNPENQAKAHEGNNLGQITLDPQTPWLVFEEYATFFETLVGRFAHLRDAVRWTDSKAARRLYEGELTIIKQQADGTLTTEF